MSTSITSHWGNQNTFCNRLWSSRIAHWLLGMNNVSLIGRFPRSQQAYSLTHAHIHTLQVQVLPNRRFSSKSPAEKAGLKQIFDIGTTSPTSFPLLLPEFHVSIPYLQSLLPNMSYFYLVDAHCTPYSPDHSSCTQPTKDTGEKRDGPYLLARTSSESHWRANHMDAHCTSVPQNIHPSLNH